MAEEKTAWESLLGETEEAQRLVEKIQQVVEKDERTRNNTWGSSTPPPPPVPFTSTAPMT